MNDPDSAINSYERDRLERAEVNKGHKSAVFDALDAARITEVQVDFDGEGDSGQIGSVIALRGEEPAELPGVTVTIRQVNWRSLLDAKPVTTETNLSEAIEILCYGYLEENHGGWEIDGGSYGEFRFDVAERTIHLEFNGVYRDVHTTDHTF